MLVFWGFRFPCYSRAFLSPVHFRHDPPTNASVARSFQLVPGEKLSALHFDDYQSTAIRLEAMLTLERGNSCTQDGSLSR